MDIKEYIESGIIESYVFGFASDQERKEVECMSSIYPELKDELRRLQNVHEEFAQQMSLHPPAELKTKILNKIANTPQESNLKVVGKEVATGKAKPLYVYLAAASIAALIGISSYVFVQNDEISTLENQMNQISLTKEAEIESLKNENQSTQQKLEKVSQRERLISNPNAQQITLAGTDLSPESVVRVYYDSESSQIVVVRDELPTPAKGKQYQLWVIADGTPVDLGMLYEGETFTDVRSIESKGALQAFAITLEEEGGVESPTLEQMYVVGAIGS